MTYGDGYIEAGSTLELWATICDAIVLIESLRKSSLV
jgi:hypothetical protein